MIVPYYDAERKEVPRATAPNLNDPQLPALKQELTALRNKARKTQAHSDQHAFFALEKRIAEIQWEGK